MEAERWRDGNPKKQPKRNSKDKKPTVTMLKIAFDGLVSRLDILKDRISELEDKSIDFLKPPNKQANNNNNKTKRRKKKEQNRTEYLKNIG